MNKDGITKSSRYLAYYDAKINVIKDVIKDGEIFGLTEIELLFQLDTSYIQSMNYKKNMELSLIVNSQTTRSIKQADHGFYLEGHDGFKLYIPFIAIKAFKNERSDIFLRFNTDRENIAIDQLVNKLMNKYFLKNKKASKLNNNNIVYFKDLIKTKG